MTSHYTITSMLIVDDDLHFSRVLHRSLSKHNISCHCARNRQEAIALAEQHIPNAITLDLRLDEDSGLSLIPLLSNACPDARIVMLTGYASIPTAVEAIKQGAHNYLHKPATLQELINAFANQGETPSIKDDSVMSIDRMEWEHIQRVLNEHDGNISATARALNMHRRTLQRKLQKYAPR